MAEVANIRPERPQNAWQDVRHELESARQHFPPMRSAHEGWAILKEEEHELMLEVFRQYGSSDRNERMRLEAVQVAAMAIRFIEDVCDQDSS
jgi:hypothetical protein